MLLKGFKVSSGYFLPRARVCQDMMINHTMDVDMLKKPSLNRDEQAWIGFKSLIFKYLFCLGTATSRWAGHVSRCSGSKTLDKRGARRDSRYGK